MLFRPRREINDVRLPIDVLAVRLVQQTAQQGRDAKISSVRGRRESGQLDSAKDQGHPLLKGRTIGSARLIKFRQAYKAAGACDAHALINQPRPGCGGHKPDKKASIDEVKAIIGKNKRLDRKSTRLNSSHSQISYAVF